MVSAIVTSTIGPKFSWFLPLRQHIAPRDGSGCFHQGCEFTGMFVLKALCSAAKPCGHFVDKKWPPWDSWSSLKMIKSRWLSHCMELAVCFGHFSPTTETGHRCSVNHTQEQLKSSKKTYTAKKKEKHILQALLAPCHIAQEIAFHTGVPLLQHQVTCQGLQRHCRFRSRCDSLGMEVQMPSPDRCVNFSAMFNC